MTPRHTTSAGLQWDHNFDAFNVFNHPDFDAPNNDVDFFPGYAPPVQIPPAGSLGVIQHTIGSPRFLQLDLHLHFLTTKLVTDDLITRNAIPFRSFPGIFL